MPYKERTKRDQRNAKHLAEVAELKNQVYLLEQRVLFAERPFKAQIEKLTSDLELAKLEANDFRDADQHMLLWCPECHERHIDEGTFAVKGHRSHACQHCGHVWMPRVLPTIGVRFLPGFKDK